MEWTTDSIITIRNRLRLSRPEFARLVGVDTRTVYRWESGEGVPSGPGEAVLLGIDQALRSKSSETTE